MKIQSNFDLTNYNSYRLKAICKNAYFPNNENEIVSFFQSFETYFLLGSGHNIILSKDYYDTAFLIFNGNFQKAIIDESTGIIEAEAGISMLDLSQLALANGLSGLEVFYDIPSSLGGAVVMNAGASGEEIKDVLLKVRYLDLEDMLIKEILKDDINFKYRNSFFQLNTNKIILKVWIQLIDKEKLSIRERMDEIKKQRWDKQPKEFPNAGSVFKRPTGKFVGPMLDELGLKGYSIGGAQVSEKHSGFIVNKGNATGVDILELIKEIQKRVKDNFDVELEIEQRII